MILRHIKVQANLSEFIVCGRDMYQEVFYRAAASHMHQNAQLISL